MNRKEILKKVQQIDIRLRRKVHSLFSGSCRSAFKGRGMVFSDVREYVPGDDVRSISWSLTAKMSKPFIKTFEEDREAQFIIAADVSSSMDFGTGEMAKKTALQNLAALIAFCAKKNKDRAGLLLFSDDIELYIPPKKNPQHSFRIVREIFSFKRKSSQTNIQKAFSFLSRVLKRKSHIFVLSDFLNAGSFEKPMKRLNQKHDVINLVFSDIFEREIPPLGLVDIEDIESGALETIDLSSPFIRKKISAHLKAKTEKRNRQFIKSGCEQVFIDCQKDIYQPLAAFFQKRIRVRYN